MESVLFAWRGIRTVLLPPGEQSIKRILQDLLWQRRKIISRGNKRRKYRPVSKRRSNNHRSGVHVKSSIVRLRLRIHHKRPIVELLLHFRSRRKGLIQFPCRRKLVSYCPCVGRRVCPQLLGGDVLACRLAVSLSVADILGTMTCRGSIEEASQRGMGERAHMKKGQDCQTAHDDDDLICIKILGYAMNCISFCFFVPYGGRFARTVILTKSKNV